MRLEGSAVSGEDAGQAGGEALAGSVVRTRARGAARRAPPRCPPTGCSCTRAFTFSAARERGALPGPAGGDATCTARPTSRRRPGSTHGYDSWTTSSSTPRWARAEEHAAFCSTRARARPGPGAGRGAQPHGHRAPSTRSGSTCWRTAPRPSTRASSTSTGSPVKDGAARTRCSCPILGDQYGVVLERGELKLGFRDGAFFIHYYDHLLPLAPRQYARVLRPRPGGAGGAAGRGAPRTSSSCSPSSPPSTTCPRARRPSAPRSSSATARRRSSSAGWRRWRAASPEVAEHIAANVKAFNGTPGDARSASTRWTSCWRAAATGWPTGAWRARRSTTAASSTSTGWRPSGWRTRTSSTEAHQRIFDWLREGSITGLRIDHPDGLFDPTAYFLNLQEQLLRGAGAGRSSTPSTAQRAELWPEVEQRLRERWQAEAGAHVDSPLRKALYVVVEKIQGGRERIPEAWAVHGTTGYRFANAVGGLFVRPDAEAALTGRLPPLHRRGAATSTSSSTRRSASSCATSCRARSTCSPTELNRISEMNRRTRDFTLNSLRRALAEFIALFPVYRTYVDDWRPELDERDVRYIQWTIAARQGAQRHHSTPPSSTSWGTCCCGATRSTSGRTSGR